MSWRHELRAALNAILFRRRHEREMEEEFAHHVEMEREYQLKQGASAADAERLSRRAFGNAVALAEWQREERGAGWYELARQDLRIAARTLVRRPGFTALLVVTLGIGIGSTTTLFSVVNRVLMAPLPYQRSDQLAVVWSGMRDVDKTWVSYDEYEAFAALVPAYRSIALFTDASSMLTGGDRPERVRSGQMTENIFRTLGVAPMLGRSFTREEDRPNGPPVVILGNELWQRRFAGDESILNKPIEIDGTTATVIGVMPPGFRLPLDYGADGATELFLPLATDAEAQGAIPGPTIQPGGGGSHSYYAIARLAPGTTAQEATRQTNAYLAGLVRDGTVRADRRMRATAVPIEDQIVGSVKPAILVIFGAVCFVLLIACANVAGLLLVRGDLRRRELAVRGALGAGPRRIGALLLTEAGLLASMGGALGLALAYLGVFAVRRFAPASLPRIQEASLSVPVVLFALGLTTVVALLAGVLPSMQARRVNPADELKQGGRGASTDAGQLRWRQTLVSVEVALAVVLVIGAGLMLRSVQSLLTIDPGFSGKGVLTARISTPELWYHDSADVTNFWTTLSSRVASIPGVRAVGAARLLPLDGEMGDWGVRVAGYVPPEGQSAAADWQIVTPGYMETMRLHVRAGRTFNAGDDLVGPLSLIVNQTFVDSYLGGRSALGAQVGIGNDSTNTYTIVGVVDDVRHNGLTTVVRPQLYATVAQFARSPGRTRRSMYLTVRHETDSRALAAQLHGILRELDPRLPLSDVRTMDEIIENSIAAPSFAMQLLSVFGFVALLLAVIGVFGIVSQVVVARSKEFGIRSALGATPRQLLLMSLRTGQRQVIVGLAVGIVASLALVRLISQLLYGISSTDPLVFLSVVFGIGALALAASIAPARRVAKANVSSVLRRAE